MHAPANLSALRTAIPYVRAYKGGVFLVKLGGAVCEPGKCLENLAEQLALLHQLGIKLVIVHGGGPQASALGERLGVPPNVLAGRRITDAATLEIVKMALAGTVNTNLLAALRASGVPAVGLSGIDGGLLTAVRRPIQTVADPVSGDEREVDYGHVGDIVEVRPELLKHLLVADYVPLVCCLAADRQGGVLNINADTAATHIALALQAAKYFLVTSVDGVMRDPADPATLQSCLDLQQVEELVRGGTIRGGMLPKVAACTAAVRGGVPRVHIINGTVADTLLGEVFTNEGCGTLIVERHNGSKAPPVGVPVT